MKYKTTRRYVNNEEDFKLMLEHLEQYDIVIVDSSRVLFNEMHHKFYEDCYAKGYIPSFIMTPDTTGYEYFYYRSGMPYGIQSQLVMEYTKQEIREGVFNL